MTNEEVKEIIEALPDKFSKAFLNDIMKRKMFVVSDEELEAMGCYRKNQYWYKSDYRPKSYDLLIGKS